MDRTSLTPNMQGLLNAGLSKTLVTTVMRTQDTESFLAAAEALLVKEPISSATASLLWDEAAVKIGAPPGAVRSRAAFVALVDISTLASRLASGEMLQGWQAPLNSRPLWSESQGFLEFLQRFGTGERYFWIMEGASIASLMWAASLPTSSAAGKALKTALRMVLSDLFSALATAATTGQPLSALHASFKQAIFTEDLDQPTMDIIRSLGHANMQGFQPPTFECAIASAHSAPSWAWFVAARLSEDDENPYPAGSVPQESPFLRVMVIAEPKAVVLGRIFLRSGDYARPAARERARVL